jgi:hypothetical protein
LQSSAKKCDVVALIPPEPIRALSLRFNSAVNMPAAKKQKLEPAPVSALESLKSFTTVVADTGDFNTICGKIIDIEREM